MVFRNFTSISNEISKICKIHVLIQSCTLHFTRINKLKSLKVAQSKDDDGCGVVNACMNGCVSDVMCDVVCVLCVMV